jgi:hypothetical protein
MHARNFESHVQITDRCAHVKVASNADRLAEQVRVTLRRTVGQSVLVSSPISGS